MSNHSGTRSSEFNKFIQSNLFSVGAGSPCGFGNMVCMGKETNESLVNGRRGNGESERRKEKIACWLSLWIWGYSLHGQRNL